MSEQDKPERKPEAGPYITGGNFGPTIIGSQGKMEGDIIAHTVNRISGTPDKDSMAEFLSILEQIKTSSEAVLPTLNEYEAADLERSLATVEDHAKRPQEARDPDMILQALDKVKAILARAVPLATLAHKLWEIGRQIFMK